MFYLQAYGIESRNIVITLHCFVTGPAALRQCPWCAFPFSLSLQHAQQSGARSAALEEAGPRTAQVCLRPSRGSQLKSFTVWTVICGFWYCAKGWVLSKMSEQPPKPQCVHLFLVCVGLSSWPMRVTKPCLLLVLLVIQTVCINYHCILKSCTPKLAKKSLLLLQSSHTEFDVGIEVPFSS